MQEDKYDTDLGSSQQNIETVMFLKWLGFHYTNCNQPY